MSDTSQAQNPNVSERMLSLIKDQAELGRIIRQESAEESCKPNFTFTPPDLED